MYPSSPLTPMNVVSPPPGAPVDVDDIQGDVLIGLQKNSQLFVFFQIADAAAFKVLLRSELARRLTMTRLVIAREFQVRDAKDEKDPAAAGSPPPLPLIGINIAFSQAGLVKLVGSTVNLGDASFTNGALASAQALGDPIGANNQPSNWLPPYLGGTIDGVILITGGSDDDVNAELTLLQGLIGSAATVAFIEHGAVRPGLERGHEHFGFADGISQPAPIGLPLNAFPGQRGVPAGHFVFGYDGQLAAPPLPWMVNGSFMVFRRLKQFVPEFNATIQSSSAAHGMDEELLGARMMGRWKSGAPAVLTPEQDNPGMGGDPNQNNNFDYSDDEFQRKCPYGAHIRKLNPRVDIDGNQQTVDPRRIMRAGIPFGPELSPAEIASKKTATDRGLLFVCYQTSILQQFEFLQSSWANNTGFVFGKVRPDESASPVTVGFDPIIGQHQGADRSRATDEPVSNYPQGDQRSEFLQPTDSVIAQGGAYFFVPSFSAVVGVLSN